MQFLQNLQGCAELPLATIDYHEVGHRPVMLQWSVLLSLSIVVVAALFVVGFPAEASTQHLLVTGKIVWTFDRLNLETPVFAILGPARLKHDIAPTELVPCVLERS